MSSRDAIIDRRPASAWGVLFGVLLAAGVAWWIASFAWFDAARTWRALLVSFIFFTPLAVGLPAWSAIVVASRGRWHVPVERATFSTMNFMIPSFVALAALWAGGSQWAPWCGRDVPQGAWLNGTFVFARDVILLAALWAVAWRYVSLRLQERSGPWSGIFIVAYCAVWTVISFDLVMSLDPRWYSTLFGAYFFVTGAYSAVAAWTFIVASRPSPDPDKLHDLGKLIVAFSLLMTYTMFAQLIVIWYEELPREAVGIVPRKNFFPWTGVSYLLIAVVYLGPLYYLLTTWAKRNRWFIGSASLVIMAGIWIERWWLVTPTFSSRLLFSLPEASIAAAFVGALGLSIFLFQRGIGPFAKATRDWQ